METMPYANNETIEQAIQKANEILDGFEKKTERTRKEATVVLDVARLYNEVFYGLENPESNTELSDLQARLTKNQHAVKTAWGVEASNSLNARKR